MGDAVNLASRLEGANKAYSTHIMVGPRTREEAAKDDPDLAFRPLDLIAVKGKNAPVEVFELVGRTSQLTAERKQVLALYARGLEHYRRRAFLEALAPLREALGIDAADGPARTYVARCEHFLAESPAADWDGVYRLTSK
jgi:adenylate cyclase